MKKAILLAVLMSVIILLLASCNKPEAPIAAATTSEDNTTDGEIASVSEVTTVEETETASETTAEEITSEADTTEEITTEEITTEETFEVHVRTSPLKLTDLTNDIYKTTEGLLAFGEGSEYSFVNNVGYDCKIPLFKQSGELFADAEKLASMLGCGYKSEGDKLELTFASTVIEFTVGGEKAAVGGQTADCTTVIRKNGRALLPVSWTLYFFGYSIVSENGYLFAAGDVSKINETEKKDMTDRFEQYKNTVCDLSDVEIEQTGVGKFEKTAFEDRLVGIAYTTWMRNGYPNWGNGTWDLPLLGKYTSDDRDVIYQHGVWLAEAGVDFVFVDWSNNTDYDPSTMRSSRADFRMIEEATDLLFEIWSTIPNAPKICIFVGPGHNGPSTIDNGNHQKKVDQVYNDYVNGKYKDMYFYYEGKPLLMCYGATPNQYGSKPKWTDDRFTVRWVTGFIGQQSSLFKPKTMQSNGFWSWEERGLQTFTVVDKKVECVTCTAASRSQGKEGDSNYIPAYGRQNGETLKKQFQRANDLGAKIVLLVSWNEWTTGEQISLEISKDLEPSQTYGTFYYDLMCQQIKKFKGLAN